MSPLLLLDFRDPDTVSRLRLVHDGVMGGVSRGQFDRSADGNLRFRGVLSLENNGGFASFRSPPTAHRLAGYRALRLSARGDGLEYTLNVWPLPPWDRVAFRYRWRAATDWHAVQAPFTALEPRFRGRPVPQAPPLDPNGVGGFGILIGGGQSGPFAIELERLEAVP